MPRRLARKLMLSITVIVIIVAAVSGLVNVTTEERQLLDTMILGADQLSKGIASATWHAMLDDHREAAYQVMQTIAAKQGIDRIRMFNRAGQVMFSTNPEDKASAPEAAPETNHDDLPSRVRIFRGDSGSRRLAMATPIYNEPSCSQAQCHAHPAELKVLGVLDLRLNLDRVDHEVAAMKYRVLLVTAVEITLISLFIIYFTRRFLSRPIDKLIEGTKAVSQMELDKPLDFVGSSEELDELARSFDVMRDRLRTALGEINQFTQNLETKVEERTQQLKAAQRKLLQSDRLASLGQLSASVAHEINNPVSGVLNLSMLLQRMLKDDGIPQERIAEFRRYLGQVTSETARVGRIVSDLLAFSRRGKPQRAPADLNRIVRMTLSLVEHKMKLSNVAVEATYCEDLPAAPCDSSQIQQVVLNLLLNAAEATHSRTHRRVTVSTAKGDGVVLMQVSDNGEGIPPENLAKIFDPFFTTKPEGKGVGLGLAVSYGIVDSHGGELEVKSTVGEGTTFTLSLPLVEPPGRVSAPGALGAPRMKYLYVAASEEVEDAALAVVTARIEAEFGAPVRNMELGSVEFAYDAQRRQYGSIPLLDSLLHRCPADALKLLAVTGRDLYIPVLTFVFGQAQLGGRVGVVSLARLRQEFYGLPADHEVFLGRVHKEALHETGHLFGLVHCAERTCAMSLATTVRQIDMKDDGFCAVCRARVRRHAAER